MPDHTTVGLSAGYATELQGKPVRIDAFVRNLFGERVVNNRDTAFSNIDEVGSPLTIGIATTMSF